MPAGRDGKMVPDRRALPHKAVQRVIGRNMQGGDRGGQIGAAMFERKSVKAVIVHDIKAAACDPFASGGVGGIQVINKRGGSAMFGPWENLLVMNVDDRVDVEQGVAVTRSEQGHIMAAALKARSKLPGVSLHAAGKGLRDALPHMRQYGYLHVAETLTWTGRAVSGCLASRRCSTLAVLA